MEDRKKFVADCIRDDTDYIVKYIGKVIKPYITKECPEDVLFKAVVLLLRDSYDGWVHEFVEDFSREEIIRLPDRAVMSRDIGMAYICKHYEEEIANGRSGQEA